MRISVLGAGAWGTTLSILLHYNGHQVTLWEYKKNYSKVLNKTRENKIYLPKIKIPNEINITHNLEESTLEKHLIVLAIPSQFLRNVLKQINFTNIKNSIFVSVSKGIEHNSFMTISQIIQDVFPKISQSQIGVLSGPSHAEEVSIRIPTAVVVASKIKETCKTIQIAFVNSYFRVYSSLDILGVELGGALKNIIAIGAGVSDGVKFGDNTKAAIMTRGIAEISKVGVALGAKPETFWGLSGIGDLIVTCSSKHSRNRYVGEKIGQGMKLKEVLNSMSAVAEGVETCRSTYKLAQKHKIEVPITTEVYKILFEDKDPVKATNDLMTRDIKMEID